MIDKIGIKWLYFVLHGTQEHAIFCRSVGKRKTRLGMVLRCHHVAHADEVTRTGDAAGEATAGIWASLGARSGAWTVCKPSSEDQAEEATGHAFEITPSAVTLRGVSNYKMHQKALYLIF